MGSRTFQHSLVEKTVDMRKSSLTICHSSLMIYSLTQTVLKFLKNIKGYCISIQLLINIKIILQILETLTEN